MFNALIETFLPFVTFTINKKKKINKIFTSNAYEKQIKQYQVLDEERLLKRLSEEHDRAIKIDDKTAKFTLGLSVSLTVLAAASGSFAKFLPVNEYINFISLLCGIAAIYMLVSGIISLGALKTLPRYGYGTIHEIKSNEDGSKYLAEALVLQEEINIVRHLRNEAAYQCLRNGFFVLLIALVFSIFALSSTKPDTKEVTKKDNEKVSEIKIESKKIIDHKPDIAND